MINQKILSQVPGVGRVCRCRGCPDLHVSIGPVDIRIPEDALEGLALLVSRALEDQRTEQATAERQVSWIQKQWHLS